jgi:hypothetical protein
MMAYKRTVFPERLPTGNELTSALIGIGINLAGKKTKTEPNIEDTLLAASLEGIEKEDYRVLALLTSWLEVHHSRINADRLLQLAKSQQSKVRAFWSSIGSWLHKDIRLKKLKSVYKGRRLDLISIGTDFQIKKKGEDPRFMKSALRVPAKTLRNRKTDVLKPEELASVHRTYRYRILMGPSYRADMWAALEKNPDLSATSLAKETYGSFATAWQVKRDFELLQAA